MGARHGAPQESHACIQDVIGKGMKEPGSVTIAVLPQADYKLFRLSNSLQEPAGHRVIHFCFKSVCLSPYLPSICHLSIISTMYLLANLILQHFCFICFSLSMFLYSLSVSLSLSLHTFFCTGLQ